MDLQIQQQDLSRLLSRASSIAKAPEKSTMTILACVVLTAADGLLKASATDLYIGSECSVEADIKQPGTFAVDAKSAAEICDKLPASTVRIRLSGTFLEFSVGRTKFRLSALSPETFPPLPKASNAKPMGTLLGADLSRFIARGSYACDLDTSSVKNATSVDVHNGAFRAVSFQFGRLSRVTAACEGAGTGHLLLPSSALKQVKSFSDAAKAAQVAVSSGDGYAFLSAGSSSLSIKLAEAFPDLNIVVSVVDKGFADAPKWSTFDRGALIAAVQRVRLTSSMRGVVQSIQMAFTPGSLRISGGTNEAAGEDVVECDGEAEIEIDIQPGFVLDALNAIDDDVVRLGPAVATLAVRGDTTESVVGVISTMGKV